MTLSLSRIESAEKWSNDSAQSPAWSRNALPSLTRARAAVRLRASPTNTSGGYEASVLRARSRAAASGHSGCCPAVRSRHEDGDHLLLTLESVRGRLGAAESLVATVRRRALRTGERRARRPARARPDEGALGADVCAP